MSARVLRWLSTNAVDLLTPEGQYVRALPGFRQRHQRRSQLTDPCRISGFPRVLHLWATKVSLRKPESVQRVVDAITQQHTLLHHAASRKHYSMRDVGFFRVNGYPPTLLALEMNGEPLSIPHGAPAGI